MAVPRSHEISFVILDEIEPLVVSQGKRIREDQLTAIVNGDTTFDK
jgi:hypothetical protein